MLLYFLVFLFSSHWLISSSNTSLSCQTMPPKSPNDAVASMLYLMWQLMDVNCTAAMWEYLALQSRVRLTSCLCKKVIYGLAFHGVLTYRLFWSILHRNLYKPTWLRETQTTIQWLSCNRMCLKLAKIHPFFLLMGLKAQQLHHVAFVSCQVALLPHGCRWAPWDRDFCTLPFPSQLPWHGFWNEDLQKSVVDFWDVTMMLLK